MEMQTDKDEDKVKKTERGGGGEEKNLKKHKEGGEMTVKPTHLSVSFSVSVSACRNPPLEITECRRRKQ